jgi:hypothetical protein
VEAVDLWFLDVCWLTRQLVCKSKELHGPGFDRALVSSRANWRYTDFSMPLLPGISRWAARLMVGVIDAAADEGDLFLDFLR